MVASVEDTGVDTTGYTVFHHRCGDYKTVVFQNNTVNSISGSELLYSGMQQILTIPSVLKLLSLLLTKIDLLAFIIINYIKSYYRFILIALILKK
jgi:hypothetical protein